MAEGLVLGTWHIFHASLFCCSLDPYSFFPHSHPSSWWRNLLCLGQCPISAFSQGLHLPQLSGQDCGDLQWGCVTVTGLCHPNRA